jgi:hypothetical protein
VIIQQLQVLRALIRIPALVLVRRSDLRVVGGHPFRRIRYSSCESSIPSCWLQFTQPGCVISIFGSLCDAKMLARAYRDEYKHD